MTYAYFSFLSAFSVIAASDVSETEIFRPRMVITDLNSIITKLTKLTFVCRVLAF